MMAVIMAVKARRWSGPLRQVVGVVELVSGLLVVGVVELVSGLLVVGVVELVSGLLVVGVVELVSGLLVVGAVPKKGLLLHPAGRLTLQARYKSCGL